MNNLPYKSNLIENQIITEPIISTDEEGTCYYTVYIVINKMNGRYYIGSHKSKDVYNDPYVTSSVVLYRAIKKYGDENFIRYIIKFFDSYKNMRNYEDAQIEMCLDDPMCYNLRVTPKSNIVPKVGLSDNDGFYIDVDGEVIIKKKDDEYVINNGLKEIEPVKTGSFIDESGNCVILPLISKRIKSNGLHGVTYRHNVYKDSSGNHIYTTVDDPRIKTGELISVNAGTKHVKLKSSGKIITVSTDDVSTNYEELNVGYAIYKDEDGNKIRLTKEDAKSRGLEHINKGRYKGNTIMNGKVHAVIDHKYVLIEKDDIRLKTGEAIYLIKFVIVNDGTKDYHILNDKLEEYLSKGYKKGKLNPKQHKSHGEFIY